MSTRKKVFSKLNETKKLPSPSGTTLRIIQLCHDENTSIQDIATVVQTDPAFTAEILKYANAFFLSVGTQVVSVQKAAVKLGTRTIVNLALSLSLLASNRKGKCLSFDYERFWTISLLQAIAAKQFAKAGKEFDGEEIFICALLSHMGQLALASLFPDEYGELLEEFGFESCGEWALKGADDTEMSSVSPNLLRKSLERERFEIDSSELTVELFLDWGLPAPFALAAGYYDDLDNPELGAGSTCKIAQLLNLSHQFAEICLHSSPSLFQLNIVEEAAQTFNIPREEFGTVFDTVISQWHELGEMFEFRVYKCQLYEEIIAECSGR